MYKKYQLMIRLLKFKQRLRIRIKELYLKNLPDDELIRLCQELNVPCNPQSEKIQGCYFGILKKKRIIWSLP